MKLARETFPRFIMTTDDATGRILNANLEDFAAELNAAAYQVALRHGLRGPFIDVELELWQALRAVVAAHLAQQGSVLPGWRRQAAR
jgi:hypothetical protein